MADILGPEGVNFFGKRGVNAADPIHDKDVVNLRTLQWYLEKAEFEAIIASGGSYFVQMANQGGGVPVYFGQSGNTHIFNSFSAGTNMGITSGSVITYYLQPDISVSGLTAQTITIPPFSANCNDIVTVDCFGNLTHSAGTTIHYSNLSAGTATEIISGSSAVTIRHTIWETGRTSAGGPYSTATMATQLQKGGNVSNGTFSLVAGSGNTNDGSFSSILGGRGGILSNSKYSIIGGGFENKSYTSPYAFIGSGKRGQISGGKYNTILNGSGNTIGGNYSFIASGKRNQANGAHSSILTGKYHIVNAPYASIMNGIYNFISSYSIAAWIGSGRENSATTEAITGVIVNGNYNLITKRRTFIGNGQNNFAGGGNYATILNGSANTASNVFALIGNGFKNISSGSRSFIGNGNFNTASTNYSLVLNGTYNLAGAVSSSILNGSNNRVTGTSTNSSIIAGQNNLIDNAQNSAILGGQNYVVSGNNQVLVPRLIIKDAPAGGTAYLTIDSEGFVYQTGSTASSGGTGSSGTSGTSGSSGASGTSGSSGQNGAGGSSGTSGTSGTSPAAEAGMICMNSSYASTIGGSEYFGNETSGWNGEPWTVLSWSSDYVNCGVPISMDLLQNDTVRICGIITFSTMPTDFTVSLYSFSCNTTNNLIKEDFVTYPNVKTSPYCFNYDFKISSTKLFSCQNYLTLGLTTSVNNSIKFSYSLYKV